MEPKKEYTPTEQLEQISKRTWGMMKDIEAICKHLGIQTFYEAKKAAQKPGGQWY